MERPPGGYSGAPIPRCTLISPHFLEDVWYDTFVIRRAAHVTMPTGWFYTPNVTLVSTTSYYTYFEERTFVIQDSVDYGHCALSTFSRNTCCANPNDIFFGGGRYADSLGPYFPSMYDEKIYDDSKPLR